MPFYSSPLTKLHAARRSDRDAGRHPSSARHCCDRRDHRYQRGFIRGRDAEEDCREQPVACERAGEADGDDDEVLPRGLPSDAGLRRHERERAVGADDREQQRELRKAAEELARRRGSSIDWSKATSISRRPTSGTDGLMAGA